MGKGGGGGYGEEEEEKKLRPGQVGPLQLQSNAPATRGGVTTAKLPHLLINMIKDPSFCIQF